MFSFWRLWDARNASLYSSSAVAGLLWPAAQHPHSCLLTPTPSAVGRTRARVRRSVGWDQTVLGREGDSRQSPAHRQIYAQLVSKQPPWKTTLSHLLLSSSMPVFYCWQWHYRQWNIPLAGFGQLSLLCLAGGKYTIILPEWNQLPHTYVMFVWVVSLLIREHRHLFDSAVLFEGIGFSREWQDGLIIRGQTWETQLSQVVNEEIELCGNTSQTGFDQSRKRKCQNTQKWFCQCLRLKSKKKKPYYLMTKKSFLRVINALYK